MAKRKIAKRSNRPTKKASNKPKKATKKPSSGEILEKFFLRLERSPVRRLDVGSRHLRHNGSFGVVAVDRGATDKELIDMFTFLSLVGWFFVGKINTATFLFQSLDDENRRKLAQANISPLFPMRTIGYR